MKKKITRISNKPVKSKLAKAGYSPKPVQRMAMLSTIATDTGAPVPSPSADPDTPTPFSP